MCPLWVACCERIGRHDAGDDRSWDDAVSAARVLEDDAFFRSGIAFVSHCADRGGVRTDDVLDTQRQ